MPPKRRTRLTTNIGITIIFSGDTYGRSHKSIESEPIYIIMPVHRNKEDMRSIAKCGNRLE
jgi:hypothetical protein